MIMICGCGVWSSGILFLLLCPRREEVLLFAAATLHDDATP